MDIGRWLESLGLGQYAVGFAQNDIDAEVLPELTEADLERLGLSLGHRKKLLKAIGALGRQLAPATTTTAEPAAERRQVTVLFCDLVGSTALANTLDPEELRDLLQRYHRTCATAVDAFGGSVAQYLGDGVMVRFGYPRAHEDDAERSIRCGLDLVKSIAGLTARPGEPLAARVGIATGTVIVGDQLGSAPTLERAAIGDAPNLAARLQSLAAPGEVMIASSTRRLVGDLFVCDDLGARELKGFTRPQTVYRVTGERQAGRRFDALRAGRVQGLVGREREIAFLRERWFEAGRSAGQVVVLSGEPGIGKSHLLAAFADSLAIEPHGRIEFQCSLLRISSPFYPLVAHLVAAGQIGLDDTDQARLEKPGTLLGRDSALPAIFAALLGAAEPAVSTVSEEVLRRRTVDALVQYLVAVAARGQGLVLLEDIHWIDPSSRTVFDRLVERVATLPILMIVTTRVTGGSDWLSHAHVHRLAVNRLPDSHCADLVRQIAAGRSLSDELLARILARTDGVPLFVGELARMLCDAGMLDALPAVDTVTIPTTLEASLTARLDQLAGDKVIAQTAAALGREFSYELLAAVAPESGSQLDRALERLVGAELIHPNPRGTSYQFKHVLMQNAAHGSLLKSSREALHARIAHVLATRFADRPEAAPELLAHHYAQAGQRVEALRQWQRAGDAATARCAYVEAAAHFCAALELVPGLPEGERDEVELVLRNRLGLAQSVSLGAQNPEVGKAFARALELAGRQATGVESFTAAWGNWLCAAIGGRLDQAVGHAEQLLELARQLDNVDLLLEARHSRWSTALFRGEPRIVAEHGIAGLATYDRARHHRHVMTYGAGHDTGVCAYGSAALSRWSLGWPDQARRLADDGVALAEQLEHPTSLGHGLLNLAFVCLLRGEWHDAEASAARGVALAETHGLSTQLPLLRVLAGLGRIRSGEVEGGLRAAYDGLRGGFPLGFRPALLAWLAEAELGAGNLAAATVLVTDALQRAEALGGCFGEAEVQRVLAEIRHRQGASSDAIEAAYSAALDLSRRQAARAFELAAAVGYAGWLAQHGRAGAARELLNPLYAGFSEGLDTAPLVAARALLARLT